MTNFILHIIHTHLIIKIIIIPNKKIQYVIESGNDDFLLVKSFFLYILKVIKSSGYDLGFTLNTLCTKFLFRLFVHIKAFLPFVRCYG